MFYFLFVRIVQAVFALFGVATLVFVIQHLSGDPVALMVPEGATAQDIAILREQFGFDRPIYIQFLEYLAGLLHGNLGTSYIQNIPVADIVTSRLGYTLQLSGAALAIALLVGLPIGIFAALNRGRWLEKPALALVLAAQSMPTFWSGILLILLFAVTLDWLPSSGAETFTSILLPAICLSGLTMATFARISRNAIVEELGKDYVRAAYARGQSRLSIVLRHVSRNAAVPMISIVALELANMLAGAVIVETVFAWPGLGLLAVQAIQANDFLVVQAIVLLGAGAYIVLNLAADLLYGLVDPRIKAIGG
ncbi:MAG: ABC transporter permease [Paracoccaceae bacterium]|jgi:peptide/nickel transport system permease protein